jgi:hypothetical protein
MVSDEVWHQLDPNAGRLSRPTLVRTWIAIALALAVVMGGAVVWASGAVAPQLLWGAYGITQASPPSDTMSLDVGITNTGLLPLTVLGVGASGPGLTLIDSAGPFPSHVASGATLRVTLTYRITDCAQVPAGSAPVALRIQRSWGTQTAEPRTLGPSGWRVWTRPWCGSR